MTQTPEILTDEDLFLLEGKWLGGTNDDEAYNHFLKHKKIVMDITQPIMPRFFATIRALKAEVAELKKENEYFRGPRHCINCSDKLGCPGG